MDCPQIPHLGYGEFSQRLHARVHGQRIPISGSLELTFRCNLRCAHCYLNSTHQASQGNELTTREISGIVDQLVDEECLWLLLTGGEPLLRPDFRAIYLHAKRSGLLLTLFTNGTLITPQLADLLAEWRPFCVEITLYGRTQETYERITGIPGSHARCMQGIDLLLERNVPLKLKSVAITLNRHELEAMRDFAAALGVDYRFDPMINASLDGSLDPTRLRLAPAEIIQLDLSDSRRSAGWSDLCARLDQLQGQPPYLYQCGAGLSTFHIDPFGQLSPCIMSRLNPFDLRQGTFRHGWQHHLNEIRFTHASQDYGCSNCELLSLCGQCPGWAQAEHGDPEKPVDFLCQVAHLRASAFGAASATNLPI